MWSQEAIGDLDVLKIGSKDQPILAKKGDDLRIDWGYLYAAAPKSSAPRKTIAPHYASAIKFRQHRARSPQWTPACPGAVSG